MSDRTEDDTSSEEVLIAVDSLDAVRDELEKLFASIRVAKELRNQLPPDDPELLTAEKELENAHVAEGRMARRLARMDAKEATSLMMKRLAIGRVQRACHMVVAVAVGQVAYLWMNCKDAGPAVVLAAVEVYWLAALATIVAASLQHVPWYAGVMAFAAGVAFTAKTFADTLKDHNIALFTCRILNACIEMQQTWGTKA